MKTVLALDQGTTSSRSILFAPDGTQVASSQQEFRQIFPASGWVEHDPEEIWESQRKTMEAILEKRGEAEIAALGITNQRETTVVWDAETGEPVFNAIVWQDRRTAERCEELKRKGLEERVTALSGLRLDPYFSATKVQWILDEVEGARERAAAGQLRFGTIDSWLVWKLTEGQVHVTDVSNASRTNLLNLETLEWDQELLEIFQVPASMLPEVVDSSGVVGHWRDIPIAGMAGDQQAALFGQGCVESGMAKNTYGTGCFLLMNTGGQAVASQNGLLSTVAWRLKGKVTYALEGSVFVGGALFQWLRDQLQLAESAPEIDELAAEVGDSGGCVLVPAFTGLGAPHWDPHARGGIYGLTRGTSREHLCRAALEAVALQATEVLECMERDAGVPLAELRVDGGAARSDLLMQIQADWLQREVVRPRNVETTAFGAAALAGLAVGVWANQAELTGGLAEDLRFTPGAQRAQAERDRWDKAVSLCRSFAE